jgi:hypothetical protein
MIATTQMADRRDSLRTRLEPESAMPKQARMKVLIAHSDALIAAGL